MAKKMTQKELLQHARSEVQRSKKWRQDPNNSFDDQWHDYISLYSGEHWDQDLGTDQLIVNLVWSTINVMAPAVAINNPRFIVDARKPGQTQQAIVTEEVLNYLWRRNEYQTEFRLAVLDWLLCGHGWLKVGYKSTKTPEVKAVEGGEEQVSNTDPEPKVEGVDDREDVEGNVESELLLDPGEDRPFVERVSIFNMFVSPESSHPKELGWIAQRTWRPVADVQVDDRYSETQRARVTASSYSPWDSNDGDGRGGENTQDQEPDKPKGGYCEIIEFYDLKRNTVGTFALGGDGDQQVDGWLRKPEKIPYASGHPFIMMRNYEVPDRFYPLGDVAQIESLQLELNETRTEMFNMRKKFRRGYVYDKTVVGADGIAALESDDDNVMVPIETGGDPSKAIAPLPAQITPAEFYDQSAMIQNDMDQVSGVSDYARGNPSDSIKRTATEAAMIQDAANSRAQDRLAKVENFLAEAGQRVVQLMQQYMTGEHVARIVTIPVKGWINYDAEYLQGDFDFSVRGGSTEPRNESFRRQSALQLADISIPFVEMGVADPRALYMKLLRDGFGEQEPHRFIVQPEQAPVEGAMPPGDPNMAGPPPAMPPGLPSPEGALPGLPPEGAPPLDPMQQILNAAGGPGGLEGMPPPMPGMGPTELTPDLLAALLANERGMPPEQSLPADMFAI